MINKAKLVIYILMLCMSIVFSGCPGKEQGEENNQTSQKEENKKDPSKLKELQGSIESMFAMLTGIPEKDLKSVQKEEEQKSKQQSQQGGEQSGQQGQSGSQQGEQEGGQQGEQSSQQNSQKQTSIGSQQKSKKAQKDGTNKSILETTIEVDWEKALKDVQKIHLLWNEYMVQAAKYEVAKIYIDKFDSTLNQLTNLIIMRKKEEAAIKTNDLNFLLIDFWAVYDKKSSPELMKLKFLVRNIILYASAKKWDKAAENYNLAKNSLQTVRAVSKKEEQDKINSLDFSILEMEKVIKVKDYPLTRLKGKLVIDNINEIEKKEEK